MKARRIDWNVSRNCSRSAFSPEKQHHLLAAGLNGGIGGAIQRCQPDGALPRMTELLVILSGVEHEVKLFGLVPTTGLEPVRCYSLEPESSASANSATWAFLTVNRLQQSDQSLFLLCIPAFWIVKSIPDTLPESRKWEEHLSENGKWRSFPRVPHLLQYVSNGSYYGIIKLRGKTIRESWGPDVWSTTKLRLTDFLKKQLRLETRLIRQNCRRRWSASSRSLSKTPRSSHPASNIGFGVWANFRRSGRSWENCSWMKSLRRPAVSSHSTVSQWPGLYDKDEIRVATGPLFTISRLINVFAARL